MNLEKNVVLALNDAESIDLSDLLEASTSALVVSVDSTGRGRNAGPQTQKEKLRVRKQEPEALVIYKVKKGTQSLQDLHSGVSLIRFLQSVFNDGAVPEPSLQNTPAARRLNWTGIARFYATAIATASKSTQRNMKLRQGGDLERENLFSKETMDLLLANDPHRTSSIYTQIVTEVQQLIRRQEQAINGTGGRTPPPRLQRNTQLSPLKRSQSMLNRAGRSQHQEGLLPTRSQSMMLPHDDSSLPNPTHLNLHPPPLFPAQFYTTPTMPVPNGGRSPQPPPSQQVIDPLLDSVAFMAMQLAEQQSLYQRTLYQAQQNQALLEEIALAVEQEATRRQMIEWERRSFMQLSFNQDQLFSISHHAMQKVVDQEAAALVPILQQQVLERSFLVMKESLILEEGQERKYWLEWERTAWEHVLAFREIEVAFVDILKGMIEDEEREWILLMRRIFIIFETIGDLGVVSIQELTHREVVENYWTSELRHIHQQCVEGYLVLKTGHKLGIKKAPPEEVPYAKMTKDEKKNARKKKQKSFWDENPASMNETSTNTANSNSSSTGRHEELRQTGHLNDRNLKIHRDGQGNDDRISSEVQSKLSAPPHSRPHGRLVPSTRNFGDEACHLGVEREPQFEVAPVPDTLASAFAGLELVVEDSAGRNSDEKTVRDNYASQDLPELVLSGTMINQADYGKHRHPYLGRQRPRVRFEHSSVVQTAVRSYWSRMIVNFLKLKEEIPNIEFVQCLFRWKFIHWPKLRRIQKAQVHHMVHDAYTWNRRLQTVVEAEGSKNGTEPPPRSSFIVPVISSILKSTYGAPYHKQEDYCRRCAPVLLSLRETMLQQEKVHKRDRESAVEEPHMLVKEGFVFAKMGSFGKKEMLLIPTKIIEKYMNGLCHGCEYHARVQLNVADPKVVSAFYQFQVGGIASRFHQNTDALNIIVTIQAELRARRASRYYAMKMRRSILKTIHTENGLAERIERRIRTCQLRFRFAMKRKYNPAPPQCKGCIMLSALVQRLFPMWEEEKMNIQTDPETGELIRQLRTDRRRSVAINSSTTTRESRQGERKRKKVISFEDISSKYGVWIVGKHAPKGAFCKKMCFERYPKILHKWQLETRVYHLVARRLWFNLRYRIISRKKIKRWNKEAQKLLKEREANQQRNRAKVEDYPEMFCSMKDQDLLTMFAKRLVHRPGIANEMQWNSQHSYHLFPRLVCKTNLYCKKMLGECLGEARDQCRYAAFVRDRFQFVTLQIFLAEEEYEALFRERNEDQQLQLRKQKLSWDRRNRFGENAGKPFAPPVELQHAEHELMDDFSNAQRLQHQTMRLNDGEKHRLSNSGHPLAKRLPLIIERSHKMKSSGSRIGPSGNPVSSPTTQVVEILRAHSLKYMYEHRSSQDRGFCRRCYLFITALRDHLSHHPDLTEKRIMGYIQYICGDCRLCLQTTLGSFLEKRRCATFLTQRWKWKLHYRSLKQAIVSSDTTATTTTKMNLIAKSSRTSCSRCEPLMSLLSHRVHWSFDKGLSEYEKGGYFNLLCERCRSVAEKLVTTYHYLNEPPKDPQNYHEVRELYFAESMRQARGNSQSHHHVALLQSALRVRQAHHLTVKRATSLITHKDKLKQLGIISDRSEALKSKIDQHSFLLQSHLRLTDVGRPDPLNTLSLETHNDEFPPTSVQKEQLPTTSHRSSDQQSNTPQAMEHVAQWNHNCQYCRCSYNPDQDWCPECGEFNYKKPGVGVEMEIAKTPLPHDGASRSEKLTAGRKWRSPKKTASNRVDSGKSVRSPKGSLSEKNSNSTKSAQVQQVPRQYSAQKHQDMLNRLRNKELDGDPDQDIRWKLRRNRKDRQDHGLPTKEAPPPSLSTFARSGLSLQDNSKNGGVLDSLGFWEANPEVPRELVDQ